MRQLNSPAKPENITSLIMAEKEKTLTFLAPIIRGIKGTHEQVFDDLKKQGYTKIRVDQKIYDSDRIKEELKLVRYEKHWIEAVIDTVKIIDEERLRISEAVEQALASWQRNNDSYRRRKSLRREEGA